MTTAYTLAHMARILIMRNHANQQTVLVLGSRASHVFSSPEFYETLKLFADPSFSTLSPSARFGVCYHLLTRQAGFSAADIDLVLTQSLKHTDITDADICLAELVQIGAFTRILTTCIDSHVEQALAYVGLREGHDFEVINLSTDFPHTTPPVNRLVRCQIIKVFGDLASKEYIMKRSNYLSQHPSIQQYIEQILSAHLLMIGLDPIWDAELYQTIPASQGSLWHIHEDASDTLRLPATLHSTREIKDFSGEQYSYQHFLPDLYNHYASEVPASQLLSARSNSTAILRELRRLTHEIRKLSQSLQTDTPVEQENKSAPASYPDQDAYLNVKAHLEQQQQTTDKPLEVFISYAARDEALLDDLLDHLSALKRAHIIHEWYSRKVQAGQVTQAEVNRYLQLADIILLLVSASFMASDYIHSGELQHAIALHRAGKVRVIPLLIRPCDWQGTPFSELKPLPENGLAVTSWPNQDSAFLDIVQGIRNVAEELNAKTIN